MSDLEFLPVSADDATANSNVEYAITGDDTDREQAVRTLTLAQRRLYQLRLARRMLTLQKRARVRRQMHVNRKTRRRKKAQMQKASRKANRV